MSPNKCRQCGRVHSGLCGIHSTSTNGNGTNGNGSKMIRGSRATRSAANGHTVREVRETDVRRPRLGKYGLEKLLDWLAVQEKKCLDMLNELPWETDEYMAVMERFDRLQEMDSQVRVQLAAGKHK